jgi:putative CocE/NonD family hydrolase
MRDGVALRTILLVPAGDGPWPALLTRHPYDVTGDERDGRVDLDRFVARGYLVALQDVRGRFGSEGVFDPSAQELDDGADAVAWLAALPECSGVVGMFGASYASETQFSALLGGSPALRSIAAAVTPVASAHGGFHFRGGVPEAGSMMAWSHFAIAPERIARIDDVDERAAEQARFDQIEKRMLDGDLFRVGALREPFDADITVTWMRDRLALPLDAPAHAAGKVWNDLDAIDVPVFLIGGWFDVFLGSTLQVYRWLLERSRTAGTPQPHLLVGPWSHDNMTGRIGGVDFGAQASVENLGGDGDLTEQHLRWFDATLTGAAGLEGVAPVRLFVMGANRWQTFEQFPPADAAEVALLLGADGALAHEPGEAGQIAFPSDPANAVPTRGGATLLFAPFEPGPVDQAELEERPDVVSWRSQPLSDDLVALGPVQAVIHLATPGTDADLVVRLCDEYPDGRSLVIADGIQRASARNTDAITGAGAVEPIEPGQVYEYTVDLWSTAYAFGAGHRIRLDVTSSSSPRWEVGANAFAPTGQAVVPTAVTYSLHVGAAHPSRLILTVPAGSASTSATSHTARNP